MVFTKSENSSSSISSNALSSIASFNTFLPKLSEKSFTPRFDKISFNAIATPCFPFWLMLCSSLIISSIVGSRLSFFGILPCAPSCCLVFSGRLKISLTGSSSSAWSDPMLSSLLALFSWSVSASFSIWLEFCCCLACCLSSFSVSEASAVSSALSVVLSLSPVESASPSVTVLFSDPTSSLFSSSLLELESGLVEASSLLCVSSLSVLVSLSLAELLSSLASKPCTSLLFSSSAVFLLAWSSILDSALLFSDLLLLGSPPIWPPALRSLKVLPFNSVSNCWPLALSFLTISERPSSSAFLIATSTCFLNLWSSTPRSLTIFAFSGSRLVTATSE